MLTLKCYLTCSLVQEEREPLFDVTAQLQPWPLLYSTFATTTNNRPTPGPIPTRFYLTVFSSILLNCTALFCPVLYRTVLFCSRLWYCRYCSLPLVNLLSSIISSFFPVRHLCTFYLPVNIMEGIINNIVP